MSSIASEQSEPWQIKTEMILAVLAKKAAFMTYDELAQAAEVPAPHRIHKITLYLEQLIEEDIKAHAPIRAAVIISKIRGIPAPGFFDKLAEQGMALALNKEFAGDRDGFHKHLLAALNPAFQS